MDSAAGSSGLRAYWKLINPLSYKPRFKDGKLIELNAPSPSLKPTEASTSSSSSAGSSSADLSSNGKTRSFVAHKATPYTRKFASTEGGSEAKATEVEKTKPERTNTVVVHKDTVGNSDSDSDDEGPFTGSSITVIEKNGQAVKLAKKTAEVVAEESAGKIRAIALNAREKYVPRAKSQDAEAKPEKVSEANKRPPLEVADGEDPMLAHYFNLPDEDKTRITAASPRGSIDRVAHARSRRSFEDLRLTEHGRRSSSELGSEDQMADQLLALRAAKAAELGDQVKALEEHLAILRRDLLQSEENRMQEQRALMTKIHALRMQNTRLVGVVERLSASKATPIVMPTASGLDEETLALRREVATLKAQLLVLRESELQHQVVQTALLENVELQKTRHVMLQGGDSAGMQQMLWWQFMFWVAFAFTLIVFLVYRPSSFTGFSSGPTMTVEDVVGAVKRFFR